MDAESTRRHFCKSADFAGRERLSANMTNRIENVRILTMEGPGLGEIPCGYLLYDDESGKILEVGACEGDGSGGLAAAVAGSDYIASGNIVKQTLVAAETTPTENYAINWVYG